MRAKNILLWPVLVALLGALALGQNQTVNGNLRVKGTVRFDSIAGDTTMMMVADSIGRVSVLPIPGGGGGITVTENAFLYGAAANSIVSTAAAGNGQLLIGRTGNTPLLGTLTGTSNQIAVSTGAGTLGVSIPSAFIAPGTIQSTGTLTSGAGSGIAALYINGAAGNERVSVLRSGGSTRWTYGANGVAESGSNAGSNYFMEAWSDAGSPIDVPFSIARASGGLITLARPVRATDLAGSGTRMVVADADGDVSTQAIPSGVSPANPTASVGLSAVNGSAATYMRSDAAPALDQGIRPTWTDLHTFADSVFITSPSAAAVPVRIRGASSQSGLLTIWQNNGAGTLASVSASGDIVGNSYTGGAISGSTGSFSSTLNVTNLTTAAGGVSITGGTNGVGRITYGNTNGISIRGNAGSAYDFSVQAQDGTVVFANPTGSTDVRFTTLSGASTRMVVVDSDGDVSTQAIPSGVSPANPTASVGLSAVNGSAATYMRSDAAPALDQGIRPTWTDRHVFADTAWFSNFNLLNPNPALGATGSFFRYWPRTNDGFDTAYLSLCGGGLNDVTRGACILLGGNEATGGSITVTPGNGSSPYTEFQTNGAGSVYMGRTFSSHTWGLQVTADALIEDSARVGGNLGVGGLINLNGAGRDYYIRRTTGDLEMHYGNGAIETMFWQFDSLNNRIHHITDTYLQGLTYHAGTVPVIDSVSPCDGGVTCITPGTAMKDMYRWVMTEDDQFIMDAGVPAGFPKDGMRFTLRVKQGGAGGHEITWGSMFSFPNGGTEPTQPTGAGTWSYYSFIYNDEEDTWDFVGNALNFGGS